MCICHTSSLLSFMCTLIDLERTLRCLLDLSPNGEAGSSAPMTDGFMQGDLHASNTTLVAR